jgi:hypothetical protein
MAGTVDMAGMVDMAGKEDVAGTVDVAVETLLREFCEALTPVPGELGCPAGAFETAGAGFWGLLAGV